VGVTLGALVVASLVLWRPAFLVVVTLAAGIAVWELTGAIGRSFTLSNPVAEGPPVAPPAPPSGPLAGLAARLSPVLSVDAPSGPGGRPAHLPLLPLLAGCVVMITLAWFSGVETLLLGLTLTILAAMVWRLADGPVGYQRDLIATVLIAVYVPFLAGFAVLLSRPADGDLRVIVTLAAVVLSDTGGYVAGVFFGKHPMAPTVSPKKSWEGLIGSLVATAIGGALLMLLALHRPWWTGLLFGLAIAAVSVLGDLAESLLKRDLGVKDMSSLLPGHGGLMDRLDSILFAAPTAFVLLSVLAPVTN
jgi:phosphatidate cytidylyltransferase